MKNYMKLMLGRKNIYVDDCLTGNFVGVDYQMDIDFTNKFHDTWKEFNKEYIPHYLKKHPGKAKVTAGLACGTIWTICKYLQEGDIILCPDSKGSFMVAEVTGDYYYKKGDTLPHRRPVKWYNAKIDKDEMSDMLRSSSSTRGTYCSLTQYSDEIEELIGGDRPATIISTDETVEDPSEFALEKHLEDFLIKNWKYTELAKNYIIYDDGDFNGQQFPTDTGKIDILAVSKDKKTLLVIELKKGRASDHVVGQIQRYMGYVKEELAEVNQQVKGIIIAHEDDLRIKRALSVANNIEFYRFQVSFKLIKG